MPRYVITEKAGRFVAGQRNSGVGPELILTEQQAKAGVREGTLILRKEQADVQPRVDASEAAKDAAKSAPKAKGKDDSK
jgi:hypothetical protein